MCPALPHSQASIFLQPADHECPPGPGSIQTPQLPEGKACRESPHALHIKGGWGSPSRGATLAGFVDASEWGSWGTVCRAYPSHGLCFVQTLAPEVPDVPATELLTIPLQTPESLQSLMLHLVFCHPWYFVIPKMLQRVLVGPRNCPLADLKVSLSGKPWRPHWSPQQPSGVCMGREPAPREAEAAGGSGGGLGPQEQGPEPPRCLSGFANFGSLAEVMAGSEFVSFLEEKGPPLLVVRLSLSGFPFYLFWEEH